MIARIWRGVVPEAKATAYLEYLRATGLEEYGATAGNKGVQVLIRIEDGRAELLLLSPWESWEAIRAFAGGDIERAVYYPRDAEYLLELEPNVVHYSVADGALAAP